MGSMVMEWSVRAALIAAGTAIVLGVLRVRAASAQHAAWTMVVVAMLALPAWNMWGPKLRAPLLPAAGHAPADWVAIPDVQPEGTAPRIRRPYSRGW